MAELVFPSHQTSIGAEAIGIMYPSVENLQFCYPDLLPPAAWECAYCGSLHSKDTLRCDRCGAGKPKEQPIGA